jgi:superfamily II DNA/RNA helicase
MDFNAQFIVTTAVADVGITVPDVDVVISPNFIRVIKKSPDRRTLIPTFANLDPSRLLQRKGRTGRTNNGKFVLVNFTHEFGPHTISPLDHLEEWLQAGLPIKTFLAAMTEEGYAALGYDEDDDTDIILKEIDEAQFYINHTDKRNKEMRQSDEFEFGEFAGQALIPVGAAGISAQFEMQAVSFMSNTVPEIMRYIRHKGVKQWDPKTGELLIEDEAGRLPLSRP